MISIKLTGLIDMGLLKKINDSVLLRNDFWSKNNVNEKLKADNFLSALQKAFPTVT